MYIHGQIYRVPSTLMRGGTSKGLILRTVDLPKDPAVRDQVILKIYGSPGNNQIDGVGGGTPLTSKLALVGPTAHPEAHINYTFGQVSLEKQVIDYRVTCGNMASAVGLYAAEEGYVELQEPVTCVRIFNTNTNKIIEVEIPVQDGQIQYEGDFSIAGVSGTGSRIMVNFLDSGGTFTGRTLPTGNPIDAIKLDDGRKFLVTIVDAANVLVFVQAEDLGIIGTELSGEVDGNAELLGTLERIRVKAGVRIGVISDERNVTPTTHALPKIAVIAPVREYVTENGQTVTADQADILGRYISMGTLHRAFAVSGSIALGTAAKIPGTLPHRLVASRGVGLRIGHPSGTLYVEAHVEQNGEEWYVARAALGRTARRLMDGYAYVPTSSLVGQAVL
ncbi:PrpF protein [Brevibacillus humidisoli]|uniref:2-methylaconitate cis-trans isomerase PrpF family protein n=1 Tax=Brevibacillus humidisoli TaxID=2895522 RepID=UPI001E5EDF4E|nr:PrpF domain-containing protein [Brevibacillus humidisoli]UFJ40304.1 PrpF protein [Brevibacillus humidisoli]